MTGSVLALWFAEWSKRLSEFVEDHQSMTQITMASCLLALFSILFLCTANLYNSNVNAFRIDLNRHFTPLSTPFRRMFSQQPVVETASVGSSQKSSDSTESSDDSSSQSRKHTIYDFSSSFRMSFLNDLAPPFCVLDEDFTTHVSSPDVTHFCFLLHGHRGLAKDLAYMQHAMQRVAGAERRRRASSDLSTPSGTQASDDSTLPDQTLLSDLPSIDPSEKSNKPKENDRKSFVHDLVVHSSVCNEHKTQDGIRNGGERLVEEMRQVIRKEMIKRHPELGDETGQQAAQHKMYNITISILGNSLGGLFGRYAIAKMIERHCVKDDDSGCWVLDDRFYLRLNIFCTTATPHLGVSQHTYFQLPRTAEIGVAHALGNTGKDLFRLNDLLHTMATCPTFLDPLKAFRKRIAYANAYGTDFPVPASTAAFLSKNSTYPHHFREDEEHDIMDAEINDESGLIIGTLVTPTEHGSDIRPPQSSSEVTNQTNSVTVEESSDGSESYKLSVPDQDELDIMSRSLDKLGWKKVFVDIRRELPTAEVPQRLWTRRRQSDNPDYMLLDAPSDSSLRSLKLQNRVIQSKDVATAVAMPRDNRLALPLAHNMIVAFSRSRISTFMNKGGRPVVDALANELVHNILDMDIQSSTSKDCPQSQ